MNIECRDFEYRVYRRVLFWKTGQWRPLEEVHTVLIRFVAGNYELYLVRKHGYDRVYGHASLEKVRRKAGELSRRYGWLVKEKGIG